MRLQWLSSQKAGDSNQLSEPPQQASDLTPPPPIAHGSSPPRVTPEHGSTSKFSTWPNPSEMGLQLQKLYWNTFDRIFTSWVVAASNDGTVPTGYSYDSSDFDDKSIRTFDLCVNLDREINSIEKDGSDSSSGRQHGLRSSEKTETEARTVAITTIHCFCVRWLPVLYPELQEAPLSAWHEHMMRFLWRKSRKAMLKAINTRSYQSAFSLVLFGLTPVPIGVGEEEEAEGVSGSLCFQVALHHLYSLRCWRRTLKFSTSKVIAQNPTVTPQGSSHITTDMQYHSSLYYENMLYTAGIIIDTTSSLTLDYKPILAAGNLGMEKELFFEIIKTRASITHEKWQKGLMLQVSTIGDTEADEINLCTSQWKLYFWKAVAVLKEGLRDGCSEDMLQVSFHAVLCAIERFGLTYGPMLEACMRRLDFLGFRQRFDSWLLMCHWYLAVLILVDALEASERPDLLSYVKVARDEAVQGIINGFKIGSNSRYILSDVIPLSGGQAKTVQCPLLAIDPYPVHVIASGRLVLKIITQEYTDGKVSVEAFENLLEIISSALEHLPATSQSVGVARQHVRAVQLSLGGQIISHHNSTIDGHARQDANTGPNLLADFISDHHMEEYVTLLEQASSF
ncbi:hypothetical protein N7456_002340 [Penicillium angulare]|uniref:Uncharacterized protein n=1 Tax=Penicillium angulare TaxID=116970 RepID=A0A9W9KQ60_9EURO|nr:hypothetical protein N7456_002340 [Penicillium angulare]